MTQKLPQLTARELIAILRRHGFEIDRQSGSHAILINENGRRVTVPVHSLGLAESRAGRAHVEGETLRSIAGKRGMNLHEHFQCIRRRGERVFLVEHADYSLSAAHSVHD